MVSPNPWGCYSQTDDPHNSGTPGHEDQVNVHSHTICPNHDRMPEIGVTVRLFKWECILGFICGWSPHGPQNTTERQNRWSVQATSAGPCEESGRYRGAAVHWIEGPNGVLYAGQTHNTNQVDCE